MFTKKEDGQHCHHIDFNKRNNNPTNLVRLSADEHLALHRSHLEYTLHRSDVKEKCRQLRQKDEFRQMMSARMKQEDTREILSTNAKALWEDTEYKIYMAEKWLDFYNSNPEYRQQNAQQLYEAQQKYWSDENNRQIQSEKVKDFFKNNPSARQELSDLAKKTVGRSGFIRLEKRRD